MNIDIIYELKKIILNSNIKNTYIHKYPNSKYSLDLIINELIYVLNTGLSWRNLRSKINSKTLYWHFSKFVKYDIFKKLFEVLRSNFYNYTGNKINDTTYLIVDSTIIWNKFGIDRLGRNKYYKNKRAMKISLLTDINGIPLSIFYLLGNRHDNICFIDHVDDVIKNLPKCNFKFLCDKGYTCNKNYKYLEKNNFSHIIPPRKNMKIYNSYKYDKKEYKKRIIIEHIFSRLKMFRRINLRYDKLFINYINFVYLALSIIGFKIIKKLKFNV